MCECACRNWPSRAWGLPGAVGGEPCVFGRPLLKQLLCRGCIQNRAKHRRCTCLEEPRSERFHRPCKPRLAGPTRAVVAQVSKPAVSPTSPPSPLASARSRRSGAETDKSADLERGLVSILSKRLQVWKPALRL